MNHMRISVVFASFAALYATGADVCVGAGVIGDNAAGRGSESSPDASISYTPAQLGATYYVATAASTPPGSDVNAGTADAPFLTISNAIAHAAAEGGGTIRVGDGLFEITAQLNVSVPVTIQSVNGRSKTEVRRINVLATTVTDVERCLYINNASAIVAACAGAQ